MLIECTKKCTENHIQTLILINNSKYTQSRYPETEQNSSQKNSDPVQIKSIYTYIYIYRERERSDPIGGVMNGRRGLFVFINAEDSLLIC